MRSLFDRFAPGWRTDNNNLRHILAAPLEAVWAAHDVDVVCICTPPALHRSQVEAALRAGNAELSTLLLDHGADPNATDRRGQPALAAAVHVEDIALFDRLVASGADISRFGLDVLYEAATVGRADIVHRLLGKGLDPNGRLVELPAPIVTAAAAGHVDVVETLIVAGARHDRIELIGAMHRRTGLLIDEIESRRASRAYRPVDGLYAEIDRLSDRHAAIRRLLADDDRR